MLHKCYNFSAKFYTGWDSKAGKERKARHDKSSLSYRRKLPTPPFGGADFPCLIDSVELLDRNLIVVKNHV
jgi:hypothetical protein